jgi:hypothetical protein
MKKAPHDETERAHTLLPFFKYPEILRMEATFMALPNLQNGLVAAGYAFPLSNWRGYPQGTFTGGAGAIPLSAYDVMPKSGIGFCRYDGSTQYHRQADAWYFEPRDNAYGWWIWFRPDAATWTTNEFIFAKWDTTGNARSWAFFAHSNDDYRFSLSSDGTALTTTTLTGVTPATVWTFLTGFYDESTDDMQIGGALQTDEELTWETKRVGPTNVHSGAAQVTLGACDHAGGGSLHFDGDISSLCCVIGGDGQIANTEWNNYAEWVFDWTKGLYRP